jgi:hypothetical protein
MIYARVHYHTVAEDYYADMERIEQRLDVGTPPEPNHAEVPVNGSEWAQLLELAARLAKPELGVESRLNLVEQVRSITRKLTTALAAGYSTRLGAGERACLAVAVRRRGLLASDDLDARRTAQ